VSPTRQLKVAGLFMMVLGVLVALASVGWGVETWKSRVPSREDYGQGDALLIMLMLGGVLGGTIIAGSGWRLTRGPSMARVAMLIGGFACYLAVNSAVGWAGGLKPLGIGEALAVLGFTGVGAYLLGLGVSVSVAQPGAAGFMASSPQPRVPSLRAAFEAPWVSATVVGSLVGLIAAISAVSARTLAKLAAAHQKNVTATAQTVASSQNAARMAAWRECAASDLLDAYCGTVGSIAIAPGGRFFATVSAGWPTEAQAGHAIVSLWERDTGRRLWHTPVSGDEADPHQSLSISADGHYVAFVQRQTGSLLSASGEILRSIERCNDPDKPAPRSSLEVRAQLSPDGRLMAVGGAGICLEDVATGAVQRRFATGAFECPYGPSELAFQPDGQWLYSVCYQASAWDVRSGKKMAEIPFGMRQDPEHAGPNIGSPIAVIPSRDGRRILTRNINPAESLWLWDATTMTAVHATPVTGYFTSSQVAMLDPRHMLLGHEGLLVVDSETGKSNRSHSDLSITAVAVAPDGAYVILGVNPGYQSTGRSLRPISARDLD
jgi:hypothetical protein